MPFNDPERRYAEIRCLIETEAYSLGIELRRRQVDLIVLSGRAEFANSPKTRDIYNGLVRRATQRAAARDAIAKDYVVLPPSSSAIGMAVREDFQDDWEIVTDIDDSPCHVLEVSKNLRHPSVRPHLTFRVWDDRNKTRFIDGSFVAQAFVDWPRPFPAPIALDEPSQAGKILTSLHLSKEGNTPVYISTASVSMNSSSTLRSADTLQSLLQALSYATEMQQPRIALIDLDAPSLNGEHKIHHAADVFRWLKSHGLARWARYRGRSIVGVNSVVLIKHRTWRVLHFQRHTERRCPLYSRHHGSYRVSQQ